MGFFTLPHKGGENATRKGRNPFQGGMGFFTGAAVAVQPYERRRVAIPFRVGWGFSRAVGPDRGRGCGTARRNPFQGGMGFFTIWASCLASRSRTSPSRNPFQGGMGFFTGDWWAFRRRAFWVAIPFRVGWGFSHAWKPLPEGVLFARRNPFQGGMGFFTKIFGDK